MHYFQWNKLLVEYFFNHENEGKEIYNLFIDRNFLNNISVDDNGFEDFINSIEVKIPRGSNFFHEFAELYKKSYQKMLVQGRIVIRQTPEFFGFLLFLIFALTEGDDENFNINNTYGRINAYGNEVLSHKWQNLTSQIARKTLENAWQFLQNWANEIHQGKRGFFRIIRSTSNPYAESIARHVLFHHGHLNRLLDILIESDILPGYEFTDSQLLLILKQNVEEIGLNEILSDIINKQNDATKNMLSLIRTFVKENYTERTKPSTESKKGNPPIPLKLVLNLPIGFSKEISDFGLRAYSHELVDDNILIREKEFEIKYDIDGFSNKINPSPAIFDRNFQVVSDRTKQHFIYNMGSKWLSRNFVIGEWIENANPTNDSTFLVLCSESTSNILNREKYNNYKQYSFRVSGMVLLKFEKLSRQQFRSLINVINP